MNNNGQLFKEFARTETPLHKFNKLLEDERVEKMREDEVLRSKEAAKAAADAAEPSRKKNKRSDEETARKKPKGPSGGRKELKPRRSCNVVVVKNDVEEAEQTADAAKNLMKLPTNQRQTSIVDKTEMDELCSSIVRGTMTQVREHSLLYWKIFRARNMRNIVNLWMNMNNRCNLRCSPDSETKDGPGVQSVMYRMNDNTMMISLFGESCIARNQLYYCAHTLNIAVDASQIPVNITSKKDDSDFYLVWLILRRFSNRLCVLCVDKDNNIVDTINTYVYDANLVGTDLIMSPLNLMTQYVARNTSNTRLISMRTSSRDIRGRLKTLETGNITNLFFSLKEVHAGDETFLKFDIYGVTQDARSFHTIFFNTSQIKHVPGNESPVAPVEMKSRFVELMKLAHLNHLLSLLSFSIKSMMTFITAQISQEVMLTIRYNINDQQSLEYLARYYQSCDDGKKDYDISVIRDLLKKAVDIYLCLSYDIVDLGSFHYNIQHKPF